METLLAAVSNSGPMMNLSFLLLSRTHYFGIADQCADAIFQTPALLTKTIVVGSRVAPMSFLVRSTPVRIAALPNCRMEAFSNEWVKPLLGGALPVLGSVFF